MRFRGSLAAPESLKAVHQDLNDAFWSRDPKNEQLYQYETPTLVLDKALIGRRSDVRL
jgi:hypothetical protein